MVLLPDLDRGRIGDLGVFNDLKSRVQVSAAATGRVWRAGVLTAFRSRPE